MKAYLYNAHEPIIRITIHKYYKDDNPTEIPEELYTRYLEWQKIKDELLGDLQKFPILTGID